MSKKCRRLEAIKQVLEELVAILGGSQGKLQSWEQKCSFILAIRSLRFPSFPLFFSCYLDFTEVDLFLFSQASLSPEDSTALSVEAISKLVPLAEKEAHDQTVETFLQSISVFLQKIKEFPATLEKFFKGGLSSDKATVRKSHLLCLLDGLPVTLYANVLPLVDTAAELVKKVSPQTVAQARDLPLPLFFFF